MSGNLDTGPVPDYTDVTIVVPGRSRLAIANRLIDAANDPRNLALAHRADVVRIAAVLMDEGAGR